MSSLPWDSDRPLTLGTARAVVRDCFPTGDFRSLEPLGSGWHFDVFFSADGWVFRFPRREEVDRLFEQERPVLDLARSILPPSILVPEVQVLDPGVQEFPFRVSVHRFLPGIPADQVDPELGPALARSVAEALGAMHGVPESSARAAGLGELDRSEPGRAAWFKDGSAGVLELAGRGAIPEEAVTWMREVKDPFGRFDAPHRMIHHDLSPEHLLADPSTGQLVGILDWGDAILGDPARDFAPLVTFGGWQFADKVLDHYPHRLDQEFRARLRFMARFLPLMWLGHGFLRGEDIGGHLKAVRNAFTDPGPSWRATNDATG